MADKICRKCGDTKPIECFSVDKKNKTDGHVSQCKDCANKYYLANKERQNSRAKERYDLLTKDQKLDRQKKAKEMYDKEYHREYYRKNKERIKANHGSKDRREYNKQWKIDNKEYVKEYNRRMLNSKLEWQKHKLETVPSYRINRAMGAAIRRCAIGKGGISWQDIVGYSKEELMEHLESLFEDGMSWDNYSDWHIDHVRPLSWFSFTTVHDENFKNAWALDNLQPLWAEDNLRKGNSFEGKP